MGQMRARSAYEAAAIAPDVVTGSVAPSEPARSAEPSRLVRWSPLGGLVWFMGWAAVVAASAIEGGGGGDTAADVLERARSSDVAIGLTLMVTVFSPLLLGVFVAGLCARLRAAGADAESVFALVGGTVFTTLIVIADVIVFAPLAELVGHDAGRQLWHARTILVLEDVSWFVLASAGFAAGLMIVASSVGTRRAGVLAGWRFWSSLALGIASFATIAFVGAFAWFLWIGAASIGMLARSRVSAAAGTQLPARS
jgi:hypothetical protein